VGLNNGSINMSSYMFPMIEPDVVPPGDGSGEPVLLQQTFKGSAWLGQRMF
jgi:hypothetical protein